MNNNTPVSTSPETLTIGTQWIDPITPEFLRAIAKFLDVTARQIATEVGITFESVSRHMNGRSGLVRKHYSTLMGYLHFFENYGVDPYDLEVWEMLDLQPPRDLIASHLLTDDLPTRAREVLNEGYLDSDERGRLKPSRINNFTTVHPRLARALSHVLMDWLLESNEVQSVVSSLGTNVQRQNTSDDWLNLARTLLKMRLL